MMKSTLKFSLIFFLALFCRFVPGIRVNDLSAADYSVIDVHAHFLSRRPADKRGYAEIARRCIEKMDKLGIKKTVIMPHPLGYGQRRSYTYQDFLEAVNTYPDRLAFMGGGGTLNVLLNRDKSITRPTERQLEEFKQAALGIVKDKAVGFGEISPEHFSLGKRHPYESFPPDHPYLLLLADIAAEYGLPVEIHMEAIPNDMDAPAHLKDTVTPGRLKANIKPFEALLDHNPQAVIIWSHVGWDNSGARTPELCAELFDRHPNLYMNVKTGKDCLPENSFFDDKRIKKQWLDFFRRYQDRIMFASDLFYGLNEDDNLGRMEGVMELLRQLPEDIANKIARENARKIFKL